MRPTAAKNLAYKSNFDITGIRVNPPAVPVQIARLTLLHSVLLPKELHCCIMATD